MADDGGYEVMGPTAGTPQSSIPQFPAATAPGPPAPSTPAAKTPTSVPPPPPPKNTVAKSVHDSEVDSAFGKDKKKKKPSGGAAKQSKNRKAKTSDAESVMENADGDGKAAYQRPNGCDMCQLAFVWFLVIIVIGVSIPVLLAAMEKAKIPFIFDKLRKL